MYRTTLTGKVFLADSSNGHAYGTMLCPSVCNVCIVAKLSEEANRVL